MCILQSQQPSERACHAYGFEISIVFLRQMTLPYTLEQLWINKKYESPFFRETTQLNLNEAHGIYVIGSNLCCFLWGRISRRLHCLGSNILSFLPSSLCSREQSVFHIFYLSCSLLQKSHVLLVVHLPVQKNSVPLLTFYFYSPITYLKKFSDIWLSHSLCSLFVSFTRIPESRTNSLFFFLFQGEAISKEFAETGVWIK